MLNLRVIGMRVGPPRHCPTLRGEDLFSAGLWRLIICLDPTPLDHPSRREPLLQRGFRLQVVSGKIT